MSFGAYFDRSEWRIARGVDENIGPTLEPSDFFAPRLALVTNQDRQEDRVPDLEARRRRRKVPTRPSVLAGAGPRPSSY